MNPVSASIGRRIMVEPNLSDSDQQRVDSALIASYAPSTLKTYASIWRTFERWCHDHGHNPFPTHPRTLCAYLAQRGEEGAAVGTLDLACTAVAYYHRDQGLPSPTADIAVRKVRRGIRRMYGAKARRRAHPLDLEEIHRILAAIDRTSSKGLRDAAVILLGFASAMRPSELANLTLADLQPQRGGLLLHIRAAKNDPERRGQVVAIASGRHKSTDPLAALDDWITRRGNQPGRVFTAMQPAKNDTGRVTMKPIHPLTISDIVNRRARAAGLHADRITGHSMRAGHATSAALAGVPIDQIAAQTRHRDLATLVEYYIRPAQALRHTSSQHLGL